MWLINQRGFNQIQTTLRHVVEYTAESSIKVTYVSSLSVLKLLLAAYDVRFWLHLDFESSFSVRHNIWSVISFVSGIVFGVFSAIKIIRLLEIIFFRLIKLATMMQKGTLHLPSWIPRAALHSMRFVVGVLKVASIQPSRSLRTAVTAGLNEKICMRCKDRILKQIRSLRFVKRIIIKFVVFADPCLP